ELAAQIVASELRLQQHRAEVEEVQRQLAARDALAAREASKQPEARPKPICIRQVPRYLVAKLEPDDRLEQVEGELRDVLNQAEDLRARLAEALERVPSSSEYAQTDDLYEPDPDMLNES
ncbi:unnamed protein product, partial [Polarella glacialis]